MTLLPERHAVPLGPLAAQLSFVRQPHVWGAYFRRGLMRLSEGDVALLTGALDAAEPAGGAAR
ncbi:MAG: hypothetical protein ACP5VP_10985 [Candidatus Limnocylindrales bacterium]